jgi:release factor glutamine methyltransferase
LTPPQADAYAALVERAAAGEPIPYLRGWQPFFDRTFRVSPAALIPRPETELLVEQALTFIAQQPIVGTLDRASTAADIGTGSGAIAVTLAARCPHVCVHAVDISPAALTLAQANAADHHAAVTFWQGDLLTPLLEKNIHLDLILANLPYIRSADVPNLAVSRYEPNLALDGGADGLDLVRRLLPQARQLLKPNGLILLEIGYHQGAETVAAAQAVFPNATVRLLPDLAGLDRVVCIQNDNANL